VAAALLLVGLVAAALMVLFVFICLVRNAEVIEPGSRVGQQASLAAPLPTPPSRLMGRNE
jgi:hypothetical protein